MKKFIIRTTRDPETGHMIHTRIDLAPNTEPTLDELRKEIVHLKKALMTQDELIDEINILRKILKEQEERYASEATQESIEPTKELLLNILNEAPELFETVVRKDATHIKDTRSGSWKTYTAKTKSDLKKEPST